MIIEIPDSILADDADDVCFPLDIVVVWHHPTRDLTGVFPSRRDADRAVAGALAMGRAQDVRDFEFFETSVSDLTAGAMATWNAHFSIGLRDAAQANRDETERLKARLAAIAASKNGERAN